VSLAKQILKLSLVLAFDSPLVATEHQITVAKLREKGARGAGLLPCDKSTQRHFFGREQALANRHECLSNFIAVFCRYMAHLS
jgi:hypothetical protein